MNHTLMRHVVVNEPKLNIRRTLALSATGTALLEDAAGGPPEQARVSARMDEAHVRACVAARCDAVVVATECNTLVVVDFIANEALRSAQAAQSIPQARITQTDELHIGRHARIFAHGHTLYVRAKNIDVRAELQQRLRGASIAIG